MIKDKELIGKCKICESDKTSQEDMDILLVIDCINDVTAINHIERCIVCSGCAEETFTDNFDTVVTYRDTYPNTVQECRNCKQSLIDYYGQNRNFDPMRTIEAMSPGAGRTTRSQNVDPDAQIDDAHVKVHNRLIFGDYSPGNI